MSNNTQILNIRYKQPLNPYELNKLLYNLFTPGVIHYEIEYNLKFITIKKLSCLIKPYNQPEIILRIDITSPITIENLTNKEYLIARYRYEKPTNELEFYFTENIINETDIIIGKIIFDLHNNIIKIDYNYQTKAKLNLITINTPYPYVPMLDGYTCGNEENQIPLNNNQLSKKLNAEYCNNYKITDFIINRPKTKTIYNINENKETIEIELPKWLNIDELNKGIGVLTDTLLFKKIQKQDEITLPDSIHQIPVANNKLQKNLNAEYLNSYSSNYFSKSNHTHNLDEIIDTENYKKIFGVTNNLITHQSIKENSIDYTKIDDLAYNSKTQNKFQPIFETGKIILKNYNIVTVNFSREINNPVIFLQRTLNGYEVQGCEKRYAKILTVTNTYFTVQQCSSIINSNSNYIRSDSNDPLDVIYYYFVIGEAKNV